MRGLLGLLRLLIVIFLSGCGGTAVATFLDSSEPTAQDSRSSAILKGYSIYSSHNVAYKINHDEMSWAEARNRCIADGGDLAVADTRDKINYIRNRFSVVGTWLYVGIYRPAGSQKWIRVDNGLPTTSLPSHASAVCITCARRISSVSTGWNCAVTTRYGYQLTDVNCRWKLKSVCQIVLDEVSITTKSEQISGDSSTKISETSTTTRTTSEMIPLSLSSASSYTSELIRKSTITCISSISLSYWLNM